MAAEETLKELEQFSSLPKLVVFDLDDTLWYPEMYLLSGAPFRKDPKTKKVYDRASEEVLLFKGARKVLEEIRLMRNSGNVQFQNLKIGLASRTHHPDWAMTCLKMLELSDGTPLSEFCDYFQIYPGNKKTHFSRLAKQSGISFDEMIFFDNERRNCISVSELGVVCVYTPHGQTHELWREGLEDFSRKKSGY